MDRIIAESPLMRRVLQDVSMAAVSSASIFITGESGTGKEVIAKALHAQSERAHAPFIKVNCAAIPDALIESEFFGHEKGSFTGAILKRIGRFEMADGGTLLLDEISEVPLHLQAKLLRAVQELEFERIGSCVPISVNIRFISTSNRNMKETIEKKLFREDLYYRLNVIPIHLPPLRERKEDILPLADYFLHRFCLENKKAVKTLSKEASRLLEQHLFPGNIRELANLIERTSVMHAEMVIEPDHLRFDAPAALPPSSLPAGMTLQELEKRLILETLSSYKNNKTHTAKALGISLRTLGNKLKEYGSSCR
jgi:two-component system, NtrC family, response regulator AtoC